MLSHCDFFGQLQKLYKFEHTSSHNVYNDFLSSIDRRSFDNFMTFFKVYLRKSNIEENIDLESDLGKACLQIALEYYFL